MPWPTTKERHRKPLESPATPRRGPDKASRPHCGFVMIRHGDTLLGKAVRMEPETAQRVVTVFRSRLRDDAEEIGYGELAARMEARARQSPGFVDFKTYAAPDGERVSLIVFDTLAHQHAWRDDPEHRVAQRRGRDAFYAEYSISVCQELGQRHFRRDEARRAEHVS